MPNVGSLPCLVAQNKSIMTDQKKICIHLKNQNYVCGALSDQIIVTICVL